MHAVGTLVIMEALSSREVVTEAGLILHEAGLEKGRVLSVGEETSDAFNEGDVVLYKPNIVAKLPQVKGLTRFAIESEDIVAVLDDDDE